MISTQSLVKHLLVGPSAPLIELSFRHSFNFCSSCPLIISQMQRCCREEQQSLTAVLSLPSAHSDRTASPQLKKSALYNLCLIHPSDLFLKCLQLGGRVIQQLRPDAFFMASAYSEQLSIPVTVCF